MSRIRGHLRSNLVGYVALFVALTGTAYAAGTIGTTEIADNSVRSVDVRDARDSGGGLTAADLRRDSVGSSEVRDDHLTGADVKESSLGRVPRAVNSDQLGGTAAAGYQRRVTEACAGGAIKSVLVDGTVSCTDQSVFPISDDLLSDPGQQYAFTNFGPSELRLFQFCANDHSQVRFINDGDGGATLNWSFSQGGTSSTVNASGTSVGASAGVDFNFTNRVEGQWIFADGAGVTTVNLHGFFLAGSPSFCEFKGTALWAPG